LERLPAALLRRSMNTGRTLSPRVSIVSIARSDFRASALAAHRHSSSQGRLLRIWSDCVRVALSGKLAP
jgi:hypothetical protein